MNAEALLSLAVRVAAEQSVQGVLRTIVEGCAGHPDIALARIWLASPGDICVSCFMRAECLDQTECFHLVASAGTPLQSPGEDWSVLNGHFRRMPVNTQKVGRVGGSGRAMLIHDVASEREQIARPEWAQREGIRSFAGYPLISGSKTLGVLAVFTRVPLDQQGFTWMKLFADQAAVAIVNARALEARNQAEDTLRRSEASYRSVVEVATDAVVTIDRNSRILFANSAASKMFGYALQELIGESLTILMPDYLRELHKAGLQRFVSTGQRHINWEGTELIGLKRNGEEFPVEVAFGEATTEGGQVFTGFIRDITERKRAEEEHERLRQAQADLAHINRVSTMGELTAALTHEVKQPISAAVTNAKTCMRWLSRDQPDLTEARDAASRLIKDVTRASDIISRIGSLFKKGPLRREMVNVNEIIREMIALLRSEAAKHSISIDGDLASDVPQIMVDRVQLQQVLMNLMLNGIEAMTDLSTPGKLTISSRHEENGQLLISVVDVGSGIKPEQAEHIFHAFVTSKPQGTGMGLAISRSIIESHGGRLWATPNSGPGTTFQFTMPIETAAREVA
jgi:PAS domain S-box-containing protein